MLSGLSAYDRHTYSPGGAASYISALNAKCQAPDRPFPLAPSAIEQVRGALSASTELTERVQRVVDRIAGPLSTCAGEIGAPDPGGIIPDLAVQAERTKSGIREAHEALIRLEALFGL